MRRTRAADASDVHRRLGQLRANSAPKNWLPHTLLIFHTWLGRAMWAFFVPLWPSLRLKFARRAASGQCVKIQGVVDRGSTKPPSLPFRRWPRAPETYSLSSLATLF